MTEPWKVGDEVKTRTTLDRIGVIERFVMDTAIVRFETGTLKIPIEALQRL
jgi:hypothetical protein